MAPIGGAMQMTNCVRDCGDDNCCRHEDKTEGEDGPRYNVDGVINMTAEVNSRRQSAGKKLYHKMDPINICEATGVEIKFRSEVHHWRRNAYISTKNAFEDAQVVVEDDDEEDDEDDGVAEGGLMVTKDEVVGGMEKTLSRK